MGRDMKKPESGTKDKKRLEQEIEDSLKRAGKAANRGDYAVAASIYQEIAGLAEAANDRRAVDFCVEEAKCNLKLGKDFNVGWAYKCAAVYSFAFEDFSSAVNFTTKAIEFFLKADSMYAVQWCYNLLGQAGEKMGDYDFAMKNYRKSLEIEHSEEIEEKISSLSNLVPTLTIEHKCRKSIAKEGEKIDVLLTIKNESKETASDIKILGEKSTEAESIPSLRPGESKTFKYKIAACEKIKPIFCEVTWKDAKGEQRKKLIDPPQVCVIPNIEIRPYLKDRLEVGKKSLFVVSVANNSKQKIEDIDIELTFPAEFKVYPVTGYSIESIFPGEEKGFVFKILPVTTGKTILKPVISFRDVLGRRYMKNMDPFFIDESLGIPVGSKIKTEQKKPVDEKDFDRVKHAERFKKYLESFMRPKEMEESGYVKLTKHLNSAIRGYTLRDVDMETVSGHIKEECRSFAPVAEHASENYKLLLFSGDSKDGATYLLTVAIKAEDDMVHLAFRLYSDMEDELEDILEKISDISEYTIIAMSLAKEIQKIEVKETINIIDSIVQRSRIGEKIKKKDKNVEIEDSIVQRTEL